MRKFWLIVPLIIVVGLGTGAYAWWQSPVTSTVDYGSHEASNVLGSETVLKPWQTDYFLTRVPTTLRAKTSTNSALYGSYLLTNASPRISDQVGVTVAKLGTNSLSELPAVKLRLNQPDVYTQSTGSQVPAGAYVFTRHDDYESSVFWQQGDQYAAVVASGTAARRAELEQAVQAIVTNWIWQ